MIFCPRCGTQNPPHLPTCALCGSALAPMAGSPVRAELGRTVPLGATLGLASPVEAPPPDTAAAPPTVAGPRTGFGGTVLGIPTLEENAAPPTPPPAATRLPVGRATLVGTGPPEAPHPAGSARFARTMVGMAPPEAVAPADAPPTADPAAANAPGAVPLTRTILGIARPGIAPLNPGLAKSVAAEAAAYPSPPPPPPSPGAVSDATISERRREGLLAARQNSRMAWVAVLGAGLLLVLAAGLFFVFRGPGAVEGRAVLAGEGREQLELRCSDCADGTRVKLGVHEAEFKAQRALLSLERALDVGQNEFTLALRPPGSTRESRVALSVPLEYRVRADLGGLGETPPRLRVRVDALPGSEVRVNGQAVTLDAAGKSSFDLDVSAELTGLESTVRRFERRVPYSVKPPAEATANGEVAVQLGIVPLLVDAPGDSITTDAATFVLAGRTLKGGAVGVEGRPLQVGADGRFAQVMSVSQIGETTVTVRAAAPNHAPRLFALRVRRVASLHDEGARLRTQATTAYSAIATGIEQKRGWKVALDGSVLEHRPSEYASLFLLDARSGCAAPPCLARVVYGARANLDPGERVSVFGRVAGAVEGPRTGTTIPEIIADFVLEAKR